MIETRGKTLKEAAIELVKIANVNDERSFQALINDLENGCKSGLLSEELSRDLQAIIRVWWNDYRKKMIIAELKPELQELVKAVDYAKVMGHSEKEEIFALCRLYGGPGKGLHLINVAIEFGYMKGVRDERKRRKEKSVHQSQ